MVKYVFLQENYKMGSRDKRKESKGKPKKEKLPKANAVLHHY